MWTAVKMWIAGGNGDAFTVHLPDGPAQQARDAEWAKAGDRSPDALRWLYGFDAGELAKR
jgi:hypothetical protein